MVAAAGKVIIFDDIDSLAKGLRSAVRGIWASPNCAVEGDVGIHEVIEFLNAILDKAVAAGNTTMLKKLVHLSAQTTEEHLSHG